MRTFTSFLLAIALIVAAQTSFAQKKLTIIGSSTSFCVGPTVNDSCYVSRLRAYFNKQAPNDTTINNDLAVAGSALYRGMPSTYIPPYTDPALQPDPLHNITAALATHPDVVLINYPTNGYDSLPLSNVLFCFRTIRDVANQAGVPCFITTTQPRSSYPFVTSAAKRRLADLKDSILLQFGSFAIDFYTGLFNPADSSIRYDAGDGTHMNNTGHDSLYQRVLRKNIFLASLDPGTGLQGAYYNNITLTGTPAAIRIDPAINFEYIYTAAAPFVTLENYSVRWSGQVKPLYSETYTFYTATDDGVRLWVNGVQLVNNWVNQGATEKSGSITLAAGQKYDIIMEYYQGTGYASAKLFWSSPSTPKAIIPPAQLYPSAIIFPKPPVCASNFSPADGSSLSAGSSTTFIWNTITEASSYDIYFWSEATAPTVPAATITSNTYNASGLVPGATYYWYVTPRNAGGTATDCIYNSTSFTTTNAAPGNGLQGAYYNNTTLTGNPVTTRIDPVINFDYVYKAAAPGVNLENYSVRWTGQVQPLYSETYTFYAITDDGVRLWINGVQLIDNWVNHGATEKSNSITLAAGQKYDIVMEYYQSTGYASAKLFWSSSSTPKAIIPAAQLFPPVAAAAARITGTILPPVSISGVNTSLLSVKPAIAPNPVKPGQSAWIQLGSNKTGNAVITINNSYGQIISVQKLKLVAGVNTRAINTTSLVKGVYFIHIAGGDQPLTMKLMVE